jgi:hypothetical protein
VVADSGGAGVVRAKGRLIGARTQAVQGVRTVSRINAPRPALVEASAAGVPARVNRQGVAFVREEWRVVDRWWTEEPLSRRYFDLVLESGQNAVVFRDQERQLWFTQKA